jgi:TonB family protein
VNPVDVPRANPYSDLEFCEGKPLLVLPHLSMVNSFAGQQFRHDSVGDKGASMANRESHVYAGDALPPLSSSEVLEILFPGRSGVGKGRGPGVGAGSGVSKIGGGVSAPLAVATPDPEYTEEARIAKTQGTCVLWLVVDDKGLPRNIRVLRGLGFGLDERAIEAVKQWRFQPAIKDGRPVIVQISVEVGFHLY